MSRRNAVTLNQKLKWCKQLAEAVAYIHPKQVIHCDICLRNIAIDEELDVKLVDF